MPQKETGNLWVWKLSQALEQCCCFVNALLRVVVAEFCGTDGAAEQLEISIFFEDHVRREELTVDIVVKARCGDELALVSF